VNPQSPELQGDIYIVGFSDSLVRKRRNPGQILILLLCSHLHLQLLVFINFRGFVLSLSLSLSPLPLFLSVCQALDHAFGLCALQAVLPNLHVNPEK